MVRRYVKQLYIKHKYGDVKYIMTEDSLNKQIIYKLSDDEVEIIIKEIKGGCLEISFPHWALIFNDGKTYHLNRDGQIPQPGLCYRSSSLDSLVGSFGR